MEQYSDLELINKYLKGDRKSLEILIGKYLKSIYNFVYNYTSKEGDVEDIVQEIFLKVWKNIKKYKHDKVFKTWIFCIAKNTALDFLKKKKSITFSELDDRENEISFVESIEDLEELPDKIFDRKNLQKEIREVVNKMPAKYKEILSLYYYNEFNFREISEILNQPIDTVKSKHRRALIIMKGFIK